MPRKPPLPVHNPSCETPAWEGHSQPSQGLRAGQGCQTFGAAGRRQAQEGARTLSPSYAPFPPTQGKARPGSAEPLGSLRCLLCSGFPTRPPKKCPSCPLPPPFPFLPQPRRSSSLPSRSDDKFPAVALQTVINNALLFGAGSFH